MMQLSSKVEFDKNNFNDKKVVSLFTSLGALNIDEKNFAIEKIGTYGLPECFTDITLQMIKEIKPKTFADLVRFSGLSHGTEVWHKNAQDILSNNKNIKLNEVVCYREDMQRFFASKGIEKSIAFKVSESVRKGKGVPVEFTHVLIEKGVPPWYINSCDKIKYLFPKAHATAYIIGAFICGWYKIYYPIHFYAAYFNTKIENFYYAVIIQGIDKLNETIKELSKFVKKGEVGITEKEKQRLKIYKIALEFYCRNLKFGKIDIHKSGATQFVIDGDQLIPPFNVIEGCGDEAAASVVKARKEKQFQSIQDIVERTKLNKTIIQKMRDYGILDEFNETNQMSIFDF
jgi:DNA polymerase-3 subunit alpha (Gram-positive type)